MNWSVAALYIFQHTDIKSIFFINVSENFSVKHNTVNETVLQFRYFSHNMFSVEIIFEQSYYNFQTLCWRQVGCSESIGLHCINQALVLTGLCLNIVCFIADMQSVLPGWADCSVQLHMTSLPFFSFPPSQKLLRLKL